MSCIGAWVGIVYNKWQTGDRAQQTADFFRDNVFRDDDSYAGFPINTVFGPDLGANTAAVGKFLIDWYSYYRATLPAAKIVDAFRQSMVFWSDPNELGLANMGQNGRGQSLDAGPGPRRQPVQPFPDIPYVLGARERPVANLLCRQQLPEKLSRSGICTRRILFIYHNAWNLDKQELQLFSNIKGDKYKDITTESLCACSALPYIEETVTIDGDVYCEGALVDTVNFSRLLEDHRDLDEIWVSRIVDVSQARPPRNITESLGNLCMLFAGSLGDDDVKLFKYHAKDEGWKARSTRSMWPRI